MEVNSPPVKYYVIANDYGQERRYDSKYFMTVEQLRDYKLSEIGI